MDSTVCVKGTGNKGRKTEERILGTQQVPKSRSPSSVPMDSMLVAQKPRTPRRLWWKSYIDPEVRLRFRQDRSGKMRHGNPQPGTQR
jgi:hypothetical protein